MSTDEKFALCRRELIAKEGQSVPFCAKPIDKPNANNWCADCRKSLPFWPPNDVAPAPVQEQVLVAMGDFE